MNMMFLWVGDDQCRPIKVQTSDERCRQPTYHEGDCDNRISRLVCWLWARGMVTKKEATTFMREQYGYKDAVRAINMLTNTYVAGRVPLGGTEYIQLNYDFLRANDNLLDYIDDKWCKRNKIVRNPRKSK